MVGLRLQCAHHGASISYAGTEVWQRTLAVPLAKQPVHSHSHSPHQPTTPSVEVRVVGGVEVQRGEVPYLVSLQDARWTPTQPRYYCGGSIYDATTIITAAHCVRPFDKNYFGVSGTLFDII